MRTTKQIRRANLRNILKRYKTKKETARVTGLAEGVVSHMLNKKPDGTYHRAIGDKAARTIEKNMSLESGWMDADHEDDQGEIVNTSIYGIKIIEDVLRKTSPATARNIIRFAKDMAELEKYRNKEKV